MFPVRLGQPMKLLCPFLLCEEPQELVADIAHESSCPPLAEWRGACLQHAPEPPIKDPAQEDASKADALRIYSMEDVEKHDTRDSAWFVHKGQVGFSDMVAWGCVQEPSPSSSRSHGCPQETEGIHHDGVLLGCCVRQKILWKKDNPCYMLDVFKGLHNMLVKGIYLAFPG